MTSAPRPDAASPEGAVDRSRQTFSLPDGRDLCFAEWGDPDGFPVVVLHGTPGGRLFRHPDESKYAEAGARVITYDRPGYGGSTRRRRRSIVDCVADVTALADRLGLGEFSADGGSGGGPHVLALAARLRDRLRRVRCEVGIVPWGTPGIDWFAGMDPMNVTEFGWALEGEEVLAPEIEREMREMAERVAQDPAALLGDFDIDQADRAVLSRSDMAGMIREMTEDLVRGGHWGWVDDDLAFTKPWGFELDDVRVPVEIRYGAHDVLVPAAHGAWLAENVPGASAVVEEGQGHLGDPDQVVSLTRWLITGSYD